MTVDVLQHWGSDEDAASAARVSTGGQTVSLERLNGLIKYLISEGHFAPFEHLGATFRVEAPLFVLAQITRHRHLSFSVQSGRYTEPDPVFWVPDADRPLVNKGTSARPEMGHLDPEDPDWFNLNANTVTRIEIASAKAVEQYNLMLKNGVAKEVARAVLPQGLYTSFYVSGNLRAWFDVLKLRNGSHGHPQLEIVEVAQKIEAGIATLFPISYGAWKAIND
jgi:thymidylate synthase (FAD)